MGLIGQSHLQKHLKNMAILSAKACFRVFYSDKLTKFHLVFGSAYLYLDLSYGALKLTIG